jgi:hypothetical protein
LIVWTAHCPRVYAGKGTNWITHANRRHQ